MPKTPGWVGHSAESTARAVQPELLPPVDHPPSLEVHVPGAPEESHVVRAGSLEESDPIAQSESTSDEELDPTATGSRRKLLPAEVLALRGRLDDAHLDDARLDDARLDGARLDGARLDGARLDGARLDGQRAPREPTSPGLPPEAHASSSTAPPPPPVLAPPVLASRILAEDLAPTEPGRATLRIVMLGLGLLSSFATAAWASTALGTGGALSLLLSPGTVTAAVFSLAAIVCGALAMTYGQRAALAFALGLVAGFASQRWSDALLYYASLILGGGLFFRSYYRASTVARAVVTVGTVALSLWFALSGHLEGLVYLEPAWQSWSLQVPRIGLALIALLSLLAFMHAGTTGGAAVWAMSLLGLHALHIGINAAAALVPLHGERVGPLPDVAIDLTLASMATLGALGLAQGLATLAGASRGMVDPKPLRRREARDDDAND